MPRRRRATTAGLVFHVINRSAKRGQLFVDDGDYMAFERVLATGVLSFNVEIFACCVMPNHWHMVIMPRANDVLSRFMHWLTTTHARRWRVALGTDGEGAVYQGRFTAIPIEADRHFLWVCRYVERNPLRAALVERAEDWRWSSLWRREHRLETPWLAPWPVARPEGWTDLVNRPQTKSEIAAFRRAMKQGEPFGSEDWCVAIRGELGLKARRGRGRPRNGRKSVLEK